MVTTLIYLVLYAGGIVFLAGSIVRAVGYARAADSSSLGDLFGVPRGPGAQLKIMLPEMIFLKGLWEFNRPLWRVSFPFHFGLYLVAAGTAMGVFGLPAPARLAGIGGLVLALGGSLGLLARRLTTRTLKIYTTAGDILNLAWFAVTAALLLAGWLFRPEGSAGPLALLRGALRFDTTLDAAPVLAAALVSGAALLAYIPMTHMSHFIAKYFTYHGVRWDERAAATVQTKMTEYLTYRPTWAAPHVEADGQRTWADIATSVKGGGK